MSKISKFLVDSLEILFISFSIVLLTFLFLAQPLVVTGDSMLPNFKDKEQLIAEKISIKFEPVYRGEVIIIRHPENPKVFVIKRVIGLPGETILLDQGNVYIDGAILIEPYVLKQEVTDGKNYIEENQSITLSDDTYIVLGDNRKDSADSRVWGPINKSAIVGRTALVYYPFGSFRIAQ